MVKADVVQALLNPAIYDHPVERVELVETHISSVFIAGGYTYKLKKSVNLGFLDFSSLEKRRFYCQEEVRLNRRLAESIYLGVVCICRDESGGYRIIEEKRPVPEVIVEYAVLMRTLPREGIFEDLLGRDLISEADLRRLAGRLVGFHERAATGPEVRRGGQIETIRQNLEENFEQTRKDIGITLSQKRFSLLKSYSLGFLDRQQDLFSRRIQENRIRECHGDLRADHICFLDSEVAVFDCIEFNERFRHIDTACDVAFLAMDLDFRGYRAVSESFIAAYLELSGDQDMHRLLPFYQCYYAYARGKVEDLRLRDRHLSSGEHQKMLRQAEEHFDLALSYAARPEKETLIVVCGLSGTGKSRLAGDLAAALRMALFQSDVVRKELYGLGPHERGNSRFGAGIYSAEATRRTYDRLLDLAGQTLAGGGSVILDATFQKRRQREQAAQRAAELGCSFLIIECRCPEDIVLQRLMARATGQGGASDAGVAVYRRQKEEFEPVEPREDSEYMQAETSLPPRASLQAALEHLLEIKNHRTRSERGR